jgi:hypothetical protein
MSSEDRVLPTAEEPTVNPPASVVERIKAKKAKRDLTIVLPIPAWDGALFVRFRRLTTGELANANRTDKSKLINARVLASACAEILCVDPETGEMTTAAEILDDGNTAAVRFDGRFADAFDLSGERPDQIVRSAYEDDFAIAAHAQKLIEWQSGEDLDRATNEELEEFAGEV